MVKERFVPCRVLRVLKSILAVRGSGIDLPPGETRSDFFSTATIRFFCDFHHASRGNFRTFVAYAIGASLKVQGPGRPPGRMQACKGLRRPPTSQGRGLVTATDGIRSACNPTLPLAGRAEGLLASGSILEPDNLRCCGGNRAAPHNRARGCTLTGNVCPPSRTALAEQPILLRIFPLQ